MTSTRALFVQLPLPLDPPIQEGSAELRLLRDNLKNILPHVMQVQALTLARKGELRLFFRAGKVYYHEQVLQGDVAPIDT